MTTIEFPTHLVRKTDAQIARERAFAQREAELDAEIEADTISWTGSKYVEGRHANDVAKLIRADIRAAIGAMLLPDATYSVRCDRVSGRAHITIRGMAPEARRTEVASRLADIANAYRYERRSKTTKYHQTNCLVAVFVD